MTLHEKGANGTKGLRTGVVAVAAAAVIGVMAPVSKASAGTTTLYDNWSGIGDSGITVNAGGESYSGYPIGPQAATITVGAAAPYNVLAWCIDFTHTISVPGTYNDYTLVPLTPVGLQSVAGWLNSPQPSGLLGPGGQTIINEINYLMDLGNTLLEFGEPDGCERHWVCYPARDLVRAVSGDDIVYGRPDGRRKRRYQLPGRRRS